MVPALNIFSIRQILCGHFRIVYEVIGPQQLGIIKVHHQSRLLKNNSAIKKLLTGKKKK